MAGFLRRLFGKKDLEPANDRDAFARLIVAALNAEDSTIEVEYDSAAFELRNIDPQSKGERTFLHNSFVEYSRLDGAERDQHIAKVAHFIAQSRKPVPIGEAALDSLLPILRPRADLMAIATGEAGFSYSQSSRPFCDDMLLMLAIDTEISIGMVTNDILKEMGVSFEEALGLAIGHLDERGNHSFGQLAEGTFVSRCEDYYDCSRLLVHGLIENLSVKGNPVAIAQARSALLITGSEDLDGLRMIADFVTQDFPENERAISLTPIELRNGLWSRLKIEDHHPQSLRNLRHRQAAWDYSATQQALQTLLGEDVFVASAQLYESEGRLASMASWAKGVPTACPLVDAIHIQDEVESEFMLRSMENVIDVCGPFEEIREIGYPVRWLLPAELSAEQRQQLKFGYPDYKLFED